MSLDNKTDAEMVAELMAIKKAKGYVEEEIPEFISSGLSLRDQFTEPPFSVLDARAGNWQKKKKEWLDLGIKSELGRDSELGIANMSKYSAIDENGYDKFGRKPLSGTSIFDPYLCEIMYKWFAPNNADILDPFSGGSVRGIVAHKLGHKYTGIELRQEQVDSNIAQAKEILPPDNQPTWMCGDSNQVLDTLQGKVYDFIFSCPPYFNLEVYLNDPNDLSNMTYEDFIEKYRSIIRKSHYLLNNNSFEVFVVGDIRDEKGYYLDFVGDTKRAFMDKMTVGAKLYNEMILLEPLGTAPIRAPAYFKEKKLVKVHQNILCFKKL